MSDSSDKRLNHKKGCPMKKLIFIILSIPLFVFAKGYGMVTLLKGLSQVQNSEGKLIELKRGDKVYESDTVITSSKSIVRIVMMDTNIIDVYPSSKLLIKEYIFNPKENQKNVRLEVSEGQIKSTVKQKYDNDKNKYNVKTPVVVAGVRGTIFTTSHELKSGESRILTQEGNVMVGRLDANDQVKEFFSVKANQTIQIDKKTIKPEVKDIPKADVERQKDKDQKEGFLNISKEGDKKEEKAPRLEEKSKNNSVASGVSLDHKNKKDDDGNDGKDAKDEILKGHKKHQQSQLINNGASEGSGTETQSPPPVVVPVPSPVSTTPHSQPPNSQPAGTGVSPGTALPPTMPQTIPLPQVVPIPTSIPILTPTLNVPTVPVI